MFKFDEVYWWDGTDPTTVVPKLKKGASAELTEEELRSLMDSFAVMAYKSPHLQKFVLQIDTHRWHFKQR